MWRNSEGDRFALGFVYNDCSVWFAHGLIERVHNGHKVLYDSWNEEKNEIFWMHKTNT